MHVAPLAPAPLIWGLTWRAPLPPYQQAGIARLLAAPGVLLADEMGLGNTHPGDRGLACAAARWRAGTGADVVQGKINLDDPVEALGDQAGNRNTAMSQST